MTWFSKIPFVQYEGPHSDNPFAFRWYQPNQVISGKTMAEHLRFATAFWHSFCNTGGDPFGPGTKVFPWSSLKDPVDQAKMRLDAAFDFMEKLEVKYYCFHDFDLVEEAPTLAESEKRLHQVADYALEKQKATGIRVLWGTANLFSHPRYMNGAATNPDFRIVAHAAAQVKIALDVTMRLDGENYVFWGGREGYLSLLNTDMKRELDHLACFLSMARDYARRQGFNGCFFIEPKPCEPSKHQYDFDAATTIGFLREYHLLNDFKLNIEVNHATLAQHTFQHELQVAANAGLLGSIDANRGDYQNGWDTDQFPTNVQELTEAMLIILQAGGFGGGGINFDAKTRRNSTDPEDLVFAHIGGMDAFAKALLVASAILEKSEFREFRRRRYASFDAGPGKVFEMGQLTLSEMAQIAMNQPPLPLQSGRQEWLENLINQYVFMP